VTGSYIGKPAGKKLLRLSLEWDGGIVVSASIRGDFFAHPEESFEAAEAALTGTAAAELGESFARELSARGVKLFGVSPEDVGIAALDILARARAEER